MSLGGLRFEPGEDASAASPPDAITHEALMDEVCPRAVQNEISRRCFDIGIWIAGHDVVVRRVKAGIVAHDQISTRIDVDSAVVA